MTIVKEIISRENQNQKQNEQNDGHVLVVLRPLHHTHVFCQSIIGRGFSEQLRIYPVVIMIGIPFVQCQAGHRCFIANVKYDIVVETQATVKPIYLSRNHFIAHIVHRIGRLCKPKRLVIAIQISTATVGITQSCSVLTVQIAEIGTVGKCCRPFQKKRRSKQRSRTKAQREKKKQAQDTFRQPEDEAASLSAFAFHRKGTHREDIAGLAILVYNAFTVHQAESVRPF